MSSRGPSERPAPENERACREASKAIDVILFEAIRKDQIINKMLFIGPPGGGKRTIMQQARVIYGAVDEKKHSEPERRAFIPTLHAFLLSTMKRLCAHCPLEDPQLLDIKLHVERDLKGDETIDLMLALNLQALWMSHEIQATYKNRQRFNISASAGYFLDRIEEVTAAGYLPTEEDMMRTTIDQRGQGVHELSFEVDGNRFLMVDVGGIRGETKKW
jgi:hypothetical protein